MMSWRTTDADQIQLFSSVNSPIKPPIPNAGKEGQAVPGLNGRKASISQGQGVASSQPIRPGNRRRDTADSASYNPLSPSFTRNQKDDSPSVSTPPASLLRRKTDFKDSVSSATFGDKPRLDTSSDANSVFGSLKRTPTNPASAGVNGPSSPWTNAPTTGFGAFGNFSLDGVSGPPATPGDKKLGVGSVRGESRFKGLMGKDSSEDVGSKAKEKGPSSFENLNESANDQKWSQERTMRPMSKDSGLWGDLDRAGGASLGGDEPNAAAQGFQMMGDAQRARNQTGFSAFSAAPDQPTFSDLMGRRENGLSESQQAQQYLGGHPQEPMSPTSTNPYQSPESERRNAENEPSESAQPGFFGSNHPTKSSLSAFEEADRSQNSSAGPSRAFPPIGGLGGLGGLGSASPWSAAPGAIGTPSRTTATFSGLGDPRFGLGDGQPPSAGGYGSTGSGSFGAFSRSKMGSLFPPQMQEQMRAGDTSRLEHGIGEGPINRGLGNNAAFGAPSRDTDSPSHPSRGVLDDLFDNVDRNITGGHPSSFGGNDATQASIAQSQAHHAAQSNLPAAATLAPTPAATATSNSGSFSGQTPEPEGSSSTASNQLPPAQQRQMVMPDRMRWIYRDPQGNTQGPWSGLEMHDWYKAGFFSPELLVKKVEDNDYEPLAQLIRRIGNSREPFLVPQIGIPHGSATAVGQNALSLNSPASPSGPAQPPFASSFPSFGTTLTADQQNALERRKQEEQYLMARQKEHLVQQQVYLKQLHMQGIGSHGVNPQSLHHSSSAHSLQSQPSYGSITSPTGYQPSPGQMPLQPPGPMPGFFDSQIRPGPGGPTHSTDTVQPTRDLDLSSTMDRMSLRQPGAPQFPGLAQGPPDSHASQSQIAAALQDRARLQKEQEQADVSQRDSYGDGRDGLDRLEQFHQLRAQEGDQTFGPAGGAINRNGAAEPFENPLRPSETLAAQGSLHQTRASLNRVDQQPAAVLQPQQSFQPAGPPAPSISPLPAPAARRNRSDVADNLAAGSHSRSETPQDTPTTALAPWAKESADQGSKGPSLKEIQEAEARKTAQQEEIATAARRAQAEQERVPASQAPPPAPGLPSSANWAAGGSPVSAASNGPSAWTRQLAGKVPTPVTGLTKKTLAQIQKEEEARKNRAGAAAAAAASNNTVTAAAPGSGGKRYADLASKAPAAVPNATSSAWTTVGAGGKTKTPTAPAPAPVRSVSGNATASTTPSAKVKPAVPARAVSSGMASSTAQDEFHKWIKGALGKGLSTNLTSTKPL